MEMKKTQTDWEVVVRKMTRRLESITGRGFKETLAVLFADQWR